MSIADIASRIASAEPMRLTRDFLSDGTHVLRIEDLITVQTQAGKELAILEASVVDSDTMEKGTPVKDMISLSGEQAWRLESNMRYLKSMISACLPVEYRDQIDGEVIARAFASDQERSVLEGTLVKVRVVGKMSKNNKRYQEKNWIAMAEGDQIAGEEIPF